MDMSKAFTCVMYETRRAHSSSTRRKRVEACDLEREFIFLSAEEPADWNLVGIRDPVHTRCTCCEAQSAVGVSNKITQNTRILRIVDDVIYVAARSVDSRFSFLPLYFATYGMTSCILVACNP